MPDKIRSQIAPQTALPTPHEERIRGGRLSTQLLLIATPHEELISERRFGTPGVLDSFEEEDREEDTTFGLAGQQGHRDCER